MNKIYKLVEYGPQEWVVLLLNLAEKTKCQPGASILFGAEVMFNRESDSLLLVLVKRFQIITLLCAFI